MGELLPDRAKRTCAVCTYVTPALKAALVEISQDAQMGVATLLRYIILEYVKMYPDVYNNHIKKGDVSNG